MFVVVVFELLVVDIVVVFVGIVVLVVVNDSRLDFGSHLRDISSL